MGRQLLPNFCLSDSMEIHTILWTVTVENKKMKPIHAPAATVAVLSDPHCCGPFSSPPLLQHLDDADLRPLSYMPEFLSARGMVTLRLAGDGHPVWGPEHRARCDVAIKLAQFLTRRMLATRLNKRAKPETLVQKNILVGVPTHATSPTKPTTNVNVVSTSHRAVASAIAARTLVAPRAKLLMEQTRSRLARKLRDRPTMSEVVNAGLVPAHLVVPAARFGTGSDSETLANSGCYLPLLTQQVALNNFLKMRKLKSKIAARRVGERVLQPNLVSIDMDRVVEDMNLFLLVRLKPSEMAERRMLRDWDLAALVCPPNVRDKIRFWEDLVAVSAD
ncbi:hypothetical protein BCR44DRAFT_1433993 [Catenaria anguillulae PL171]|uniref:Uncharacterized protein n=1 Tax=Catenaria anguillulae PL171 TaxID=765915 RepID=A0A1Y2HM71_9FUNG|nr:hypothetical protein BCR44DRAFT_1433993 [Catenaria anguillulae PL171]